MKLKDKFGVVETVPGKYKKVYKFDTLEHAEMRVNDLALNFANNNPHYKAVRDLLCVTMYKSSNDEMFTEKYEIKEL